MSKTNSHLQSLIAHYLAQNYPTVLQPFLSAANLTAPDLSNPPQPDLRTLISDWQSLKLAEELAAVQVEDVEQPAQDGSWKGWKLDDMIKVEMHPSVRLNGLKRTLDNITATNLLTVQCGRLPKRVFDTSTAT